MRAIGDLERVHDWNPPSELGNPPIRARGASRATRDHTKARQSSFQRIRLGAHWVRTC
jgi:hypothetical protein